LGDERCKYKVLKPVDNMLIDLVKEVDKFKK
jgi:hypothetical protein